MWINRQYESEKTLLSSQYQSCLTCNLTAFNRTPPSKLLGIHSGFIHNEQQLSLTQLLEFTPYVWTACYWPSVRRSQGLFLFLTHLFQRLCDQPCAALWMPCSKDCAVITIFKHNSASPPAPWPPPSSESILNRCYHIRFPVRLTNRSREWAQSWWIRQTIPCTSWVSFW